MKLFGSIKFYSFPPGSQPYILKLLRYEDNFHLDIVFFLVEVHHPRNDDKKIGY